MSNTPMPGGPVSPERRPVRLIITYRTGISLRSDVVLTPRQQGLLECLTAHAGRATTLEELLRPYDLADRSAAEAALLMDMAQLDAALAPLLSNAAIERTPDGYVLTTDRALISIPR